MARQKPRKWLPPSPMKILAGGRLCTRKPMAAPPVTAESIETKCWPRTAAMKKKKKAAMAAVPPARPSMLSKKFNALTMDVIQRTVTHHPKIGFSTNRLTRTPEAATAPAITNCQRNLYLALRAFLSSHIPRKEKDRAPRTMAPIFGMTALMPSRKGFMSFPTMDGASLAAARPPTITMSQAEAMPSPPSTGVGALCALCASCLGLSTNPQRGASLRQTAV